ncbi:MAG: flavodoxin family protein [Oscillospiraceae bacterium]|nr:flavodoxin family protein [Oscillospiraceae bacterium]
MKTAVVYYSMSGNTEMAAQMIAERLGADLIRISPQKAYPDSGFKKFLWGGKSAVMGDTPALEPYSFDAENYERIIFGTPVWAGSFAPPLRTFIKENSAGLSGKRFALVACCSGGAGKISKKLQDALGITGFDAELVLIDPKSKPSPDTGAKINAFCESLK